MTGETIWAAVKKISICYNVQLYIEGRLFMLDESYKVKVFFMCKWLKAKRQKRRLEERFHLGPTPFFFIF